MKKLLNAILSALLCITLCLGFAGCNFETGKKPTEKGEQYEENKNAEITLSMCLLGGLYEESIMKSWANAFQKKYDKVGFDFKDKGRTVDNMDGVENLAMTNKLPDIIWTAGDQHSQISEKYFLDLKNLDGADEFFAGFYPALMDTTHVTADDESIRFVPRDYNALVVYYNEAVFDAAGVAYPENGWTYEDFLKTCEDLEKSGKVYRAVENDIGWPPYAYTMMKNRGIEYFNDQGKVIFDTEETEDWYDELQAFNTKYVKQGTGQGFTTYNPSGDNNIAMYINVRPALPELAVAANAAGWGLGAVTFPNYKQEGGADGYVGVGCSGYALNKDLKDDKLEWAWKFLQFCMSKEGYDAAAKWGVLVPALTELADDDSENSWRNYFYGDVEVDADAFVNFAMTPIDLNYFNKLPSDKHKVVTTAASQFWGATKAGGKSYTESVRSFLSTLSDSEITK